MLAKVERLIGDPRFARLHPGHLPSSRLWRQAPRLLDHRETGVHWFDLPEPTALP